MSPDDLPPALPCWINGRAFLCLASAFETIRDHSTGKPLRRVPLCGESEVREAVASARAAHPQWQTAPRTARQDALTAWSEALTRYAAHFARLLHQETGLDEEAALAEVAAAAAALRETVAADGNDEIAACLVPVGARRPLVEAARALAAALTAGTTAVIHPEPQVSGVVYALVELSARAGLSPGVVSLVQGGAAVAEALAQSLPLRDI